MDMDNELPAGIKSRGPRKNKKKRKNGSALGSTEEATTIETEVNANTKKAAEIDVKAKEATEVINNTKETTEVNVNAELVPNSTKKKMKREKRSRRVDNTKMDSTDHGSDSLKSNDSGGDILLEHAVGINGQTSLGRYSTEPILKNEPEENRDLRRSRRNKKRKQTKIVSPETNNTEHEDLNGATLESTFKEREQQLEDGPHQTGVVETLNLDSPTQNEVSDLKGKKRNNKKKKKKKNEPNDHDCNDGLDSKNVVGLNSSDTKGNSSIIDEQSGFSSGVKTASVMKQDECIEVSHNPEIKEIERNARKNPKHHQKKRKSSELGNTREPVEDGILDENSSQCLVGKNTSGFLENTSPGVGAVSDQAVDILCEKDSVTHSDTKEISPPTNVQSGLPSGAKTASIIKQDHCTEVSHVPENKEIGMYRSKKPRHRPRKGKSSELGRTMKPVVDNSVGDTSSQCLGGKDTSGSLENIETTSSVVGAVSDQAVDILCEKDSVNHSDKKEISPPTNVQSGLPSGAKTASIMKQDHCTEVSHAPENKEIGTYRSKKPRHRPRKGKSSELGRTMKPVVDNSVGDTSSQCLGGKDTSGSLENIETTSSVVGAVAEQSVEILREKDSINHSNTKESSPISDEQSGFPSASIMKQDDCTEVSHVPKNKEIETYKRKKPKQGKSSELGRTMQLGVVNNIDDTSSQCLAGKNNVETASSVAEAVSEQAVDILREKDSVNCSDIEPASHKRKKVKKLIDLRKNACGNRTLNDAAALDISEESYDEKSGENLAREQDALKLDGNNWCKKNGSSEEEAPSSQRDEAKDGVHLDATIEEGNPFKIPGSLPEKTLVSRSQKKLLILDVNGLLVDFVSGGDWQFKPDIIISKKAVYKRPYCDEFIEFCFDKFNVGVWSSRMKWNMDKVIRFLFEKSRHKLLFCWDQSHCSATGTNTLENTHKPLVFKELRKLWEKLEPNLPWKIGEYDETNTLLLDDSPYKALRNPANTAIFPKPFEYLDRTDSSLGPGGDLRTYLEGLAVADNVQKYVEQNPFGQGGITKSHKQWGFYCQFLKKEKTDSEPSNRDSL